jgi:hypothetical protein
MKTTNKGLIISATEANRHCKKLIEPYIVDSMKYKL